MISQNMNYNMRENNNHKDSFAINQRNQNTQNVNSRDSVVISNQSASTKTNEKTAAAPSSSM